MDFQEDYEMSAGTSEADTPSFDLPHRELPDNLIYYVQNHNIQQQSVERPSKRRKIGPKTPEAEKLDHVVVHKDRLEVLFSSAKLRTHQIPLARPLKPHVQWISATAPVPEYLEIIDESGEPLFHLPLSLSNISEDLRIALIILRDSKKWAQKAGRIFVDFEISLEIRDGQDMIVIGYSIKWNTTPSPYALHQANTQPMVLKQVLERYFPNPDVHESDTWSIQTFYESTHTTNKHDSTTNSMVVPGLQCNLYPFQKRAVQWLLHREGMEWQQNGLFQNITEADDSDSAMPCTFMQFQDAAGQICYVSHVFGLVTRDITAFKTAERQIKGGILAEEMGLGKTVEMISLILSHQRPQPLGVVQDIFTNRTLRATGATLIITPIAILKQWIQELEKHSPHLKVTYYQGIKARNKTDPDDLLNELANSDVVVTSYAVLQPEIHFTKLNPEKKLRKEPKRARLESPLMKISWWRCLLDEAQMVDKGVNASARMAVMIPRVNAWCVTGTPVRKDLTDLRGLLTFLRYDPYCSITHVWSSVTSTHKYVFRDLIGRIALRHSKANVKDEVQLPGQKRYVITMPFSAVEEELYRQVFEDLCEWNGLSAVGEPLTERWTFDLWAGALQEMLARLRLTALHPALGAVTIKHRLMLRDAPVRTAAQVLDAMIELAETGMRMDQRALLTSRIKLGQLNIHPNRIDEAFNRLLPIRKEAQALVDECRKQLRETEAPSGDVQNETSQDNGNHDIGAENDKHHNFLRNRLRDTLEVLHKVTFFIADAYFVKKGMQDPESEAFEEYKTLEDAMYNEAEALRQDILHEVIGRFNRFKTTVSTKADTQTFAEVPEFETNISKGGFESRITMTKIDALASALDVQANVLDEWRNAIVRLLLQPLLDKSENAELTGEEYDGTTKVQEELMVLVQALRFVVADRSDALTGLENALVKSEYQTSMRLAEKGEGPYPEKLIQLLQQRDEIKHSREQGGLRAFVSELRQSLNTLKNEASNGNPRATIEYTLVEQQLQSVSQQLNEQTTTISHLQQELALFTNMMNCRVEYYRQLQVLSDSVETLEQPEDGSLDQNAYSQSLHDKQKLEAKLVAHVRKRAYLGSLKSDLEKEAKNPGKPRHCGICLDKMSLNCLYTACGHVYCKDCLLVWFKGNRTCPDCRAPLKKETLYEITYKPATDIKIRQDDVSKRPSASKSTDGFSIYSAIGKKQLDEIKSIALPSPSFSTKVDTLCRHLIWLRSAYPGAKSIIFTQFREFIQILQDALTAQLIGHATMDVKGDLERFKTDSSIECFLLHTKDQAAGLNLTEASHVYLCEPMLNTALQAQAVARVDRIGQTQETCVWLLLVDGTVEERIHQLSVERRMQHVEEVLSPQRGKGKGKEKEGTATEVSTALDEVTNMELQKATLPSLMQNKGGNEAVDRKDLYDCLFGHCGEEKPEKWL